MSKTNWIGVNMNNKVRVRLTAHGGAILRENHDKLWADRPGSKPVFSVPDEDKHGCSEWQLWDLMNQFGSHLWNGCEIPFADNEVQFQVNKAPEWFPPDTAPKDGSPIFGVIQCVGGPPMPAYIRWSNVNGWCNGFRGEKPPSTIKLLAWKPATFTESDLL